MLNQRRRVFVGQAAAQERDLTTTNATQRGGQQPEAQRAEPQLKLIRAEPGELTKLHDVPALKLPTVTWIKPPEASRRCVLKPDIEIVSRRKLQRRQQGRVLAPRDGVSPCDVCAPPGLTRRLTVPRQDLTPQALAAMMQPSAKRQRDRGA